MDINIKKELNNFNLSIQINESDTNYIKNLLKFTKVNLEVIDKVLITEVDSFLLFLKEPSNYNNLSYRNYKNKKTESISKIETNIGKIFNFYYQNYFFNKNNLKEEKSFLSSVSHLAETIINSDKYEVKNTIYLKDCLSQLKLFLENYQEKLNNFLGEINIYKSKRYNIKLSKKSEFKDLELHNLDFIFYKSENTIIKDWIVFNIKKNIKELIIKTEHNLKIDLNNNIQNILDSIYSSENFLKNIKEQNSFFIILKESNLMKNYLKQKNKVLKLISKYDYVLLKEKSLKQISNLEKENKDSLNSDILNIFFNRKNNDLKSKSFYIMKNKAFSIGHDKSIKHYLISEQDKLNPSLSDLNKQLSVQKGFLSNIKYQSYYTLELYDNRYYILNIHEYEFKNKNYLKKYFL